MVNLRIAKRAFVKEEFANSSMNNIWFNWIACIVCGGNKEKKAIPWSPPPHAMLKFNVGKVAKRKLGPASIGRVLWYNEGGSLCMFSKSVGVKDSNKDEVLAILEAVMIFYRSFQGRFIVELESNSQCNFMG